MNKEVCFSTDKFIFHSEIDGGNKNLGFVILNNQEELNSALNDGQISVIREKPFSPNLTFPKNQKVILYYFGEFHSGIHEIKGIKKLKLVGENLEVYLTKNQNKKEKNLDNSNHKLPKSEFLIPDMEIREQVITKPKMIFSIPQNFEFKNIIIK